MKLSWSAAYIDNKPREWANQKRRELEQRLRVPISVYHSHGKVHFAPYLDVKQVHPVNAPTLVESLLRQIGTDGKTFAKLHNDGWSFDELFAVALYAIRHQQAVPLIGRNGKMIGVKAR